MHLVWIEEPSSKDTLIELKKRGVRSTLLYNPLLPWEGKGEFDAAFPLVDLSLQLKQLHPDFVIGSKVKSTYPVLKPDAEELASLAGRAQAVSAMHEQISVVIRTKNNADVIEMTLSALFSQSLQPAEVLVIDTGSTDQTLAILKKYPVRIKEIPSSDYYPGQVLNQGMQETRGSITVFLNSDAVMLSSLSLENLLAAFEDPYIQGVCARQIPRPDAYRWVKRDYAKAFPQTSHLPPWQPFSMCFSAIRRSMWTVRPFYTDAWGSEDVEWAIALKKRGEKLAYAPTSLVMHSHNYTLPQLYGRKFIEGEADAFIYTKPYSLWSCYFAICKTSLRDLIYAIVKRDWKDIFQVIPRRFVYHLSLIHI